jgi:hypothetical protein
MRIDAGVGINAKGSAMTPADIDALLNQLDAAARQQPYPPMGLPIHGEGNRRAEFRLIVLEWANLLPGTQP